MSRRVRSYSDNKGRECGKCGEYKPWSEYWSNKKGPYGKNSNCKVCVLSNNKNTERSRHKRFLKSMDSGVYRIKTSIGDYIGESQHMKWRISEHLIPSGKSPVSREVFKEWEVLEYVDSEVLRKEKEAYYIKLYKPKLNTIGVK